MAESFRERTWSHVGGAERERLDAIETKMGQSVAANKTFLAIPPASLTAAQVRDQTIRLTKQMNAMRRLLFGDFDDASDT